MQRNQNLAPKPPYQKVDRVQQKIDRMDKMMNVTDREGSISCYQLQKILGFGDFVFYKIMNAVLFDYPKKYKKTMKDFARINYTETPLQDWEDEL